MFFYFGNNNKKTVTFFFVVVNIKDNVFNVLKQQYNKVTCKN